MSQNDGAPSWLTEENINTAASNPMVQKAAVKAASNPAVQKAAVNAATAKVNEHAPGWAAEPVKAQAYVPPTVPGSSTMDKDIENQNDTSRHSELVATTDEIKQIQKYHLILRVCYMITAILMAVASVLTLQNAGIATVFICGYVFFFALLIFCFELGLKAVAQMIASNFGFMYSLIGRIALVMICCGMLVRLGVWGKVALGTLVASLVLNLYVILTNPKFEEYLRKKHFYAEKA